MRCRSYRTTRVGPQLRPVRVQCELQEHEVHVDHCAELNGTTVLWSPNHMRKVTVEKDPDLKKTKAQLLEDRDTAEDLATDRLVRAEKAEGELESAEIKIRALEVQLNNVRGEVVALRGQRDKLLNAIEDFEEAEVEHRHKLNRLRGARGKLELAFDDVGLSRSTEGLVYATSTQDLADRAAKAVKRH